MFKITSKNFNSFQTPISIKGLIMIRDYNPETKRYVERPLKTSTKETLTQRVEKLEAIVAKLLPTTK